MPMQFQPNVSAPRFAFGALFVVVSCTAPGDRGVQARDSAGAPTSAAATQMTVNADSGARAFVQDFYAWYIAVAAKDSSGPTWYKVLDERPGVLSDTLRRALNLDRDVQTAAAGEITGLDFDPFVAAQDPCERYVVGESVRRIGGAYRVSLFGVCGATRHATADVVAEVAQGDTSWTFVDFHYPGPDGGSLLALLSSNFTAGADK